MERKGAAISHPESGGIQPRVQATPKTLRTESWRARGLGPRVGIPGAPGGTGSFGGEGLALRCVSSLSFGASESHIRAQFGGLEF